MLAYLDQREKSYKLIWIFSAMDLSSLWAVRDDTEAKYSVSGKLGTTLALFILLATLLISCGPQKVQEKASTQQGFSQNQTKDQITLRLHTGKKEITIAEQFEIVLQASAPENLEVEFPDYSASLGDFTLKDILIDSPRMTGSGDNVRVVHQAAYLLEPYLSGTYTIPAMTVTFRDKEDDAGVTQLVTEEIEVAVQSLLPANTDTLDIKDIKPPLNLPPDRTQQFMLLGILLLLAIVAGAGLFYWKKMSVNKKPVEIPLRPEEIALQQLEKLLAENLLARHEIKLFHLRISDILRHYIENRFGLKAPERTTEEFLLELSQSTSFKDSLLGSHKALLTDFLTQCDLVKFAKHEPTVAESEKTVVICREFIEETKEKGEGEKIKPKV